MKNLIKSGRVIPWMRIRCAVPYVGAYASKSKSSCLMNWSLWYLKEALSSIGIRAKYSLNVGPISLLFCAVITQSSGSGWRSGSLSPPSMITQANTK
jgi:hypothetical protein